VLAERDFRVIWTGQAISMTGTWMQAVAQGLLVLQLWDSAFALGAVNFANAMPSLGVMLFGGVLADRGDKRRILIATQIAMAAIAVSLALLIVTDLVQFWIIIVATMLTGILFGYDMPAYQAYLPELAPREKVSQVVALNSSAFHGTRMVGPALAGAAIGVFGIATAYFLNALSFIAVIFGLLIVRSRYVPAAHADGSSAVEGLKQGLRHARGRPNVQALLLLTALACTFIFPSMAILSPYYVIEVLDAGPGVLGAFWAMSGVGSLIGALALVWWPTQMRALRIWLAALVAPASLALMAINRDPFIAVVLAGFTSISFSSQLNMFQSMLQESTPHQFRGRVMSLNGIMFNGTMPLAGIAASAAAVGIGLPAVMAISAAAYLVTAAFVLRVAAGGIERVVERSRAEYEVLAAGG
jgi:predicted MFS family arabinose efflux permease